MSDSSKIPTRREKSLKSLSTIIEKNKKYRSRNEVMIDGKKKKSNRIPGNVIHRTEGRLKNVGEVE